MISIHQLSRVFILNINIKCIRSLKQSQQQIFSPSSKLFVRCLTQEHKNQGLPGRFGIRPQVNSTNKKNFTEKVGYYAASVAIAMFAASFAAVPLYRIYCQATGKSVQAVKDDNETKIVQMKKDESRLLTVRFDASTHSSMAWNFKPLQDKVMLHPGETALAFYRATNPLDEMVIGVATYSVLPYEAGQYFNKIQCFCFEEQMLRPHEDVFMPVLFYVDPEISKDPALGSTNELVLSYTFFRSKDGEIPDLDEPIELKKH